MRSFGVKFYRTEVLMPKDRAPCSISFMSHAFAFVRLPFCLSGKILLLMLQWHYQTMGRANCTVLEVNGGEML